MNHKRVFIIRAVMGAGFGVLLSRFFYPDAPIAAIVALCAALVGLAYLTEYLRQRNRRKAESKTDPTRR